MGVKGVKHDKDKPRNGKFVQGFVNALIEIGKVDDYGGQQYGYHNWKNVEKERYEDAFMRHYLEHLKGEQLDESGYSHLTHAAWNILAILEKTLDKPSKK